MELNEIKIENSSTGNEHKLPPELSRRLSWLFPLFLFFVFVVTMASYRHMMAFYHGYMAQRSMNHIKINLDSKPNGLICLAKPLSNFNDLEDTQLAIGRLNRAITYSPEQINLYYRLGQAYCLIGDYKQATSYLGQYSKARPNNIIASLEMGFAFEKLCSSTVFCQDSNKAQSLWQTAGLTSSHFIENGEILRQEGQFDQAVEWYQRAQIMGENLQSTIAYAEYLSWNLNNETELAVSSLKKAVNNDDGWIDGVIRFKAWFLLGKYYFENEDYQQAIPVLRKVIEIVPDDDREKFALSEAYRFLGLISWHSNRLDTALVDLSDAVRVDPANIWAHLHYGKVLFLMDPNNLDLTAMHFEKGLSLAGDQPKTWENIIDFWISNKRLEQVDILCQRAKKVTQTNRCGY